MVILATFQVISGHVWLVSITLFSTGKNIPIVASSRNGFASNLTGRVSRVVGWGKPVNIVYLNFRKAIKVPPDLFWLRW